MMKHAHTSVSDVRREAVETEGFDPKDDSAVPNGQTPFPTSPLNEGAVEEVLDARQKRAEQLHDLVYEAREIVRKQLGVSSAPELYEKLNAALYSLRGDPFDMHMRAAITTLLTNLAEAQRERDLAEQWLGEETARAETAESRLSHLQTRLEEMEGATIERCAKIAERFAAANRDISTAYQEGRADAGDAIAAHIRAALQLKGESK